MHYDENIKNVTTENKNNDEKRMLPSLLPDALVARETVLAQTAFILPVLLDESFDQQIPLLDSQHGQGNMLDGPSDNIKLAAARYVPP